LDRADRRTFSISLSTEIANKIRQEAADTGRRINFIVEKVFEERYEKLSATEILGRDSQSGSSPQVVAAVGDKTG